MRASGVSPEDREEGREPGLPTMTESRFAAHM